MKISSVAARLGVTFTFLLSVLLASARIQAAPPVQVAAADPPLAPQATVDLDVTISGSGFDGSAAVDFFVTGTTNPGGVTVKKVTVLGSKKLVAKIDVADAAVIANFDIQVSLSGGRKGKGTSLFRVTTKVSDPCAQAGLDFPAFLFWKQFGNNWQVYLSDATGTCTSPVDIQDNNPRRASLSYPVAGSSNRGRIAWLTGTFDLTVLDFTVSGTTVTTDSRRVIFDAPAVAWGIDLSHDGTYAYTATEDNVVERITVDNPSDRVIVRTFEFGTRLTRVDSVNGDQSALYLNERVLAANGSTLRTELVRLDLITLETSVLATTNTNWLYESGADLTSNRIAYVDYLAGSNNCYLVQIADGTTGAVFSNGQPRFGRFPTWHAGKIIVEGYKPPSRKNKCDSIDMLIEVDPDTSAQRELTGGRLPDGS